MSRRALSVPARSPSSEPARASESLTALAERLQLPVARSSDGRLTVEVVTPLPTDRGTFDVRLFRFADLPGDHLALSVGDLSGDAPLLVRIHSECMTGEVLASQRCECAQQLAFALREIQAEGRGMVIYLRQEGRGIGLLNKLRAYSLQAQGADTVDANRLLGLPDDTRSYDAAASLLKLLGVSQVRLMTNNPAKTQALTDLGITVTDRLGVLVASNPLAARYLKTKRDRMSHDVPAVLQLVGGTGSGR